MDIRLRGVLNDDQGRLITTIYQPFADNGEWPLWDYVDFILDREGVDAAAVFQTLPEIRHPDPAYPDLRYTLAWYPGSGGLRQPRYDERIALTVAGLCHLPDAEPLLRAFVVAIARIDAAIGELVPSPYKMIDTTLSARELTEALVTASIEDDAVPPVEATMGKLRQLFQHEPLLGGLVNGGETDWSIQVNWATIRSIRELRGVSDVNAYLDRVIARICPDTRTLTVPISYSALDVSHAVGYLDAVWRASFGAHLFTDLDAASIARLTQTCDDEGDFNSLMSALADVLSRAVPPGTSQPPRGGALEAVQRYLEGQLQPPVVDRIGEAFMTLISIRHIRNTNQHGDARHRAVKAFTDIGLAFPPQDWPTTWEHIAIAAKGALDVLREEISAAFGSTSHGYQ